MARPSISVMSRQVRANLKLTQRELAEKIGTCASWVSQLENGGKTGAPKYDAIIQMYEELLGEREDYLNGKRNDGRASGERDCGVDKIAVCETCKERPTDKVQQTAVPLLATVVRKIRSRVGGGGHHHRTVRANG